MSVIWKYPVPIQDRFDLTLPKGAKILTIQIQYDQLQLWALVNPGADQETRHFRLTETGHPIIKTNLVYISTVQQGQYVWHIFEIVKSKEN